MGTRTKNKAPRRQWGADRRTEPLPAISSPASDRSLTMGRLAIVVTVLAWLGYVTATIIRQFVSNGIQNMRFASEAVSYLLIVTLLTGSALAYLITRQGYLHRTRRHRRTARADLDAYFAQAMPTLTVLVPSYREDVRVVRQTLLSAALQEYPLERVVLLIDDPPEPTDAANQALLAAAQDLPGEIQALLAEPRAMTQDALQHFEANVGNADPDLDDMRSLAAHYARSAAWLDRLAAAENDTALDHTDRFFADHVVGRLASDLTAVGEAVAAAADEGVVLEADRMLQLHRSLAWTFAAELSSFERKRYASLSNEPNKAMNLNSYIGLMGGGYREERSPDGRILVSAPPGRVDLEVPDPDYVLTLDADSVLLPEYCLRLVHLLEQPENAEIAVAQTPYSSYPGSATRLERLAGATTDLQHIAHQGMTYYGATFWVGANAVLRKRALDDIVVIERADGAAIKRYIQDRTVIEDTESSIDLGVHGWRLFNYNERLSYSATPPDFGSLCIQRQRWANGGLLVLPKLWRKQRVGRLKGERGRLAETFLRVNYLTSICWASIGLLFLLAYPYSERLLSPLVLLTGAPYFFAMASDLRRCGYKRLDVVRIYGFNLLFLPVNLSGVAKSMGQAITGRKIAFARTPKVRNRTTAPLWFVVLPYALVALSVWALQRDIRSGHYGHALFAGSDAVLALYAIVAFVGLRHSLVDIGANILNRLYRRPAAPAPATVVDRAAGADAGWAAVLHYGAIGLTAPAQRIEVLDVPVLAGATADATPASGEGAAMPAGGLSVEQVVAELDALGEAEELVLRRGSDGLVVTRVAATRGGQV